MKLDKKILKNISYSFLIIPIIIFFIGWIKSIIAIPASVLLIIILIRKFKETEDKEEVISKRNLLIVFIICFILCIISGIGGLFYQSYDWDWRNAIHRDLILYDWPVYYEQQNAGFTYYCGIWMVPSLIGKICNVFLGEVITWNIANIVLLIWCSIGFTLAMIWLIYLLKEKKTMFIILTVLIFIGFSGLDIIGVAIEQPVLKAIHIEWWAEGFQFSSMLTQLFWVFNQCIIAWLITLMFLNEKSVKNFMLLILLCLPYGPLPFLGMVPLFGIRGIKYLIEDAKKKNFKGFLKQVFTIDNIISFIAIFPIYYMYYSGNTATANYAIRFMNDLNVLDNFRRFIVFYFLEIGIYGIILYKNNKEDELYWTALISLLIIPIILLGEKEDFCMRASIPSLVLMDVLFIKAILDRSENGKIKIGKIFLVIVFMIGLMTPTFEVGRAIIYISENKKINLVSDDYKTLTYPGMPCFMNFVCRNPAENSLFYKHLSK